MQVERSHRSDICRPGLLLPAFDESGWSRVKRAVLYLIGLLYTFLGITVIMDIFMTSIAAITSKKKKVYELRPDLPESLHRKVWNDTVANLTLMSLGVSAPEILLSVIETVGHGFQAGFLGPGTIVGSAAVNILVIAFCINAVPNREIRRILHFKVFLVTGFFHVFSYLWLYLILQVITPDVVDIWEGLVTFLFFPVLVFLAYATNKNCWTKKLSVFSQLKGDEGNKEFAEVCLQASGSINREGVIHFVKEVMKYPGMTVQDAAVLAAAKMVRTEHTRMWYRIGGARILTSGKPLRHQIKRQLAKIYHLLSEGEDISSVFEVPKTPETQDCAIMEFESALMAVTEAEVSFPVYVHRTGNMENYVSVRVSSIDGKAVHGEDFDPINEVITFPPGQSRAEIMVRIIDENKYEPTEEFFLRLSSVPQRDTAKIGKVHIMEIKIIQDKSPGIIEFEKRGCVVKESEDLVEVRVVRRKGSDGTVGVAWTTVDLTARAGIDYESSSGFLFFQQGVIRESIYIKLINTMSEDKDVQFEVILLNPIGGALLGKIKKLKIIITDDDDFFDMDNFIFLTNINIDALKVFTSSWCEQIKEAMLPNGGDLDTATNLEYFLHFVFFFWKVLFSVLIPPPVLCNGWLSFFSSMFVIGLMVTLTGDIASIFGCSVGFHDAFTAMTFVAFGTSLTDAFACRFALLNGKYADSAIGDINGTAAVNVYLGLGLPWTLASIYNYFKGMEFRVPSKDLGSVVILYLVAASITLIVLVIRRNSSYFGKAETGGPSAGRLVSISILVILWMTYITVCYICIQKDLHLL